MNLLNVPKIFPMREIEKTGIEDFFSPLLENIILKIPVTVDGEEKLEERKVTEVGFVDAGLDDSDSWKRYLETVTIPHYPVIAEIKEQMMKSGAKASMMSGSGPTVFGLFEDAQTAKRALREMKQSGLARQIYLTSIYNNRRQ